MIQQNIQRIKKELGTTRLVAVSKFRTIDELQRLYNTGQRVFAENRVQEILKKKPELPNDVEWHLIGHLQTNKVKQIVNEVSLIHSVDSIKLLKELQKNCEKLDIDINILLQIHVAEEDSKYGFKPEELLQQAKDGLLNSFSRIHIVGVMSMATLTNDKDQVRNEFEKTVSIFNQLKELLEDSKSFTEISMGMSNDYLIAIQEGATMVRIGSKIFESAES